jgi:hypothetical protein
MIDHLFADPGPCPICGAAHSCCVEGPGGAIIIEQQPASAATRAQLRATAIQPTLPPGEFTTGTYRRTPPRKGGRR